MVSLCKTRSGRVLQLGPDRRRTTVPLGRVSRAAAEAARTHVRHLERAANTGTLPPEATAKWAEAVDERTHARLVRAGLAQPRGNRGAVPLGKFLDGYIAGRKDLKERTLANLKQARNALVEHFGAGRFVRAINAGEAIDWQRWLASDKELARATVSTHTKKARQFFDHAVAHELVAKNPFRALKAGKQSNEARMEYVTRETIQKVIDACPDAEWRLLFALARYAGLRIPSEIRELSWGDVFEVGEGRMTVRSPKTEHHEGGESRTVPAFPELGPYLAEAFDVGNYYVLPRLRGRALVTQAEKIIEKARVPRWGKLWQNLRSSCQTDLEQRFPSHVVCAWMGNTEQVARRHYLQVTDEHFRAATGNRTAQGAALDTEHHRTVGEQPTKNPRISGGLTQRDYPQGGLDPPKKYPRSPRILKTALRRALRSHENQG